MSSIGVFVHRWRYLVIAAWLLVAGSLNLFVPQLEHVVMDRSAAFIPIDAPSQQVLRGMSQAFGEPATSGVAYLVLERESGLTDADHRYQDAVLDRARADVANVVEVTDMWASADTAASVVSQDGRAVYTMIRLTGDTGTAAAGKAVAALHEDISAVSRPDGLSVGITGITATVADELDGVHQSLITVTAITVVLIALLLLGYYRSFVVSAIPLMTIGIGLGTARPVVALLGLHGVPVSIFSVALLSALILGGGTDYAIFLISRYHEERRRGFDDYEAYLTSYNRISSVVAASGLIVSMTCATMSVAKIGLFRTIGIPCAVGILVVLAVALTLTPALLAVASSSGWAEPKVNPARHYWRWIAVHAVRRPRRILALSLALVLALVAIVPTLTLSYDERGTQPANTVSNRGYDTVAAHYDGNELLPGYIVVRSNHDMRTSTDFAAIDSISAAVAKVDGVRSVRGVTRPLGAQIPESSLAYQAGVVGDQLNAGATELEAAQPDIARLDGGSTQFFDGVSALAAGASALRAGTSQAQVGSSQVVDGTRKLTDGLTQLATGAAQLSVGADQARDGAIELNRGIDAAVSPITGPADALRSLIAASPNCSADPICSGAGSLVSAIDSSPYDNIEQLRSGAAELANGNAQIASGAQQLSEQLSHALDGSQQLLSGQQALGDGLTKLDEGAAQLDNGAGVLVSSSEPIEAGVHAMTSRMSGMLTGLQQAAAYLNDVHAHAGDGGFYLPDSAMSDARFHTAINLFLSPDGRTARIVIIDSGDPFGAEAMTRSQLVLGAARHAANETSLSAASIETTGVSAAWVDLRSMATDDLLLIIAFASILIFLVLAMVLRSIVIPAYILISVILSYLAAVGISGVVWQHILGIPLHWAVPSMSFIALVAVGADYNLLLMSRVRDEYREAPHRGIRIAVIRAVTGTGGVITVAAVIFAITMFALLSSSITNIGQVGFTIGVGLLIDAMVVRTVMVPATAALLGRRNWWPHGRVEIED